MEIYLDLPIFIREMTGFTVVNPWDYHGGPIGSPGWANGFTRVEPLSSNGKESKMPVVSRK